MKKWIYVFWRIVLDEMKISYRLVYVTIMLR